MKHLEALNTEQRRAVEHGISAHGTDGGGPLLVIAGAGTGKTTTLAARVAHMIVNGADPARILLLTFSRRAAAEMTERAERMVATALGNDRARATGAIVWSGTFHAVGARILRAYAPRIGLSPGFTIHDREDSADLINLVRHELGLAEKATRFPLKGTCLAIYSHAVSANADVADVLARHFPWCKAFEGDLRRLFEAYVAAKQAQDVLDYDDLLLYWREMMRDAALAGEVGALFDHVLVDEYQDTNPLQAAILSALKPDGRGLTVVGDDAQSIYGFRAATVRNILDFPQQFRPPARVVTLEQNYRSTEPILAASNAVIALASERFTKVLRSDRRSQQRPRLVTISDDIAQAAYVADTVLANREEGVPLKQQAVLFRTSHHSGMVEIELARRNIPFVKFGGLKFLEAAHVKDLLAVLRWAANPRDRVAGFRVLQLLPGIGPTTAARALDRVASGTAPLAPLIIFRPPAAATEAWPALIELACALNERQHAWPADIEAALLWYQPHLERRHPDSSTREADLDQLVRLAAHYPSRERFLTEVTLDPPDATSAEAGPPMLDEDYLILSTIHSAKGQEWSAVLVLNVVDGCIPSDMATGSAEEIEEERRLLYVAMTRARDDLRLLVPQKFYVHQQARSGDRHVFASRTRFVPSGLLEHFEQTSSLGRQRPLEAAAAGAGPQIDVRARLAGMWSRQG